MPPPITTTWYYDPRTRRYHDDVTKRFLKFATVEGLMEKSLDAFSAEADALSVLIADKAIGVGEWETGMQDVIRRAYEANALLARGGLAQVTDEDREKVSEFLEFQFERLDRFAGQIAEEHWTAKGGAIRRRARMYVNSGRQIFWFIETRNQVEIGGKWERWVLIGGVGDESTCADCIALSAKGWVEIGTLPQPTDGSTQCLSSCRCSKRYSKAKKRPRVRGALRAFLKTAVVLKLMERLGFSAKGQGRGGPGSGYHAPHVGRPGEVGGSKPRNGKGAEVRIGEPRHEFDLSRFWQDQETVTVFHGIDTERLEAIREKGLIPSASGYTKGKTFFGTSPLLAWRYSAMGGEVEAKGYARLPRERRGILVLRVPPKFLRATSHFLKTSEHFEKAMQALKEDAGLKQTLLLGGEFYTKQPIPFEFVVDVFRYPEGVRGGKAQRGGPGSGYHAPHKGRPGEVGGSLPRETTGEALGPRIPKFATLQQAEQWARENLAASVDYGDSVSVEFAQSVNETVADVLDHCEWEEISITGRRGLARISIVDDWNSQADIAGAGTITIGNISWAYGDRPNRVHLLSAHAFDDGIAGVVRHEMGHIFGEHHAADFINLLKTPDWQEKFGVTKRARDNRGDCVAENFALYSARKLDGLHPDMIALLRRLTTWP